MAGLTQHIVARDCREELDSHLGGATGNDGTAAAHALAGPLAGLVRAIEGEVIPRLMLAHRSAGYGAGEGDAEATSAPSAEEVVEFARRVLADDEAPAAAYLDAIRARGVPLEALCLQLLAPAARRLGDLWNEDLCDFTEVTVGLWRLQRMLRSLCAEYPNLAEPRELGRRALLAPVPGEQHTFGLFMVAELFRRHGWDVWAAPAATRRELLEVVRRDWFSVLGLSASCERHLDALAETIRELRRGSRNRAIGVIVGGSVFIGHPELASAVGADAAASDGRQALELAEGLLGFSATAS